MNLLELFMQAIHNPFMSVLIGIAFMLGALSYKVQHKAEFEADVQLVTDRLNGLLKSVETIDSTMEQEDWDRLARMIGKKDEKELIQDYIEGGK